jgi:putative phosphoesterase
MRIGVISDTHGHTLHALAGVRMLESFEIEAVLHCGDIGSPEIPPLLKAWPAHYVFGNCDPDHRELRAAIEAAGQTCHGLFGEIELAGRRIALLHSHQEQQFRAARQPGKYDLVCYGHTHLARIERLGTTTVLNPGALYRANPHTIAVVDLKSLEATIVPV